MDPRRFTPALVLLTLLGATVAAVLAARSIDERQLDADHRAAANEARATVEAVAGRPIGRLEDLARAIELDGAPKERRFRALARPLLDGGVLNAVTFTAWVPHTERSAFERELGRPIVDVFADGSQQLAERRPDYHVIKWVLDSAPVPETVGLNVGVDPRRQATFDAAARGDRPQLSPVVKLANTGSSGLVAYVPLRDRDGVLQGFAVGVMPGASLVDTVARLVRKDLAFEIRDGNRVLGQAAPPREPVTTPVDIAGRQLQLAVGRPDSGGRGAAFWIALLGGAVAVLVTLLTLLAARRERYALALVDAHMRERDAAQAVAHMGNWEWDPRAARGSWSPELWRIFGREPRPAAPAVDEWLEWIHPDDRAGVREALDRPGKWRHEFRVVRPSGAESHVQLSGEAVYNGTSQPLRRRGTMQDVTEARLAEAALRRSERRYRALTHHAPVGMFETDAEGRCLLVNRRWCELTGLDPDTARGRRWTDAVHPEDRERVIAEWKRSAAEDREFELEYRFGRPDGSVAWISGRALALRDEHGELSGYLGTCADVTVSRAADRALGEAEKRFANAFEEAPIGMALVAPDGSFLRVNRALADIAGYSHDELLELHFQDITHPDDLESDLHLLEETIAGRRRTYQMEKRYVRADGEPVWVLLSVSLVRGDDGEPLYFVSQVEDVTERRRAGDAQRAAEERFRSAFEEAPIGMAMTSLDGRFLRVNRALCGITGYSREQLEATNVRSISHPDELPGYESELAGLLEGDESSYRTEKRYIHADGHLVPVDLSMTVVHDSAGKPLHLLSQVQDITERKRFEGQLQYLADHDSLTGLFNRRRFEEELTRELATAERYGTRAAVLAIDLDNFKYINDSLGHSIGDELITRVGDALRGRLRRTDVLARLGGDEFAIVLPSTDEEEAVRVAEGLLEAVAAVDLAELGGRTGGTVSASVGVAMFDGASQLTAEELLVDADIAMYDAKEAGRARAVVYDAGEDRQERMRARMTWGDRVRDALTSDGFVLHAQPVMSLNGDSVPRSELLLRMQGDNGDLIPPASFLYIAERFDLVQAIDRWVVSQAVRLLAEQQDAGREVVLGVNLSAKSITDPGLPEHIDAELRAHGADGRGLCFEVTETAAIVNVDRAKHFARSVGELGCELALDDFGAGFASFYYLKHLAFDLLKIDGEFVKDLTTSLTNQLVVRSVVDIARGLGKRTIAEFVGDAETLDLLRGMGVDYAQGFYVAKPTPLPLADSPLPHL